MSIVLGDHDNIEKESVLTTRYVVLIDMIPNGATLMAMSGISSENIERQLVPSEKPNRVLVELPMKYHWLSLIVNGVERARARLDHRNGLGDVYFLSCDLPEADTLHSLWERLDRDIDSDISSAGRTLCVHMGDNSYNDCAYNLALRGEDVLESYRNRYRETWFSTRSRRSVYSKASHLMFCDDHEVKNDLIASEVPPDEMHIYDGAMEVYGEYQENLLLYDSTSINKGWRRAFGEDGIITFERSNGIPNMTDLILSIKDFIHKYPLKGLVVCTGWAPIPCPEGNFFANWYRRLMGTEKFQSKDDLSILYDYLLTLVRDGLSVLLIGGDIHFGVHGKISNGVEEFDVAVSSGISNHPTTDRKLAASGYVGRININDDIYFRPIVSRGNRSYAKLHINHQGGRDERYELTMRFNNNNFPRNPIRWLRALRAMR